MGSGLYSVVAASAVQEQKMEIFTNNLVNSNTLGFKEDRPVFSSVLGSAMEGDKINSSKEKSQVTDNAIGEVYYPVLKEIVTNFSHGDMMHTGNPLDVAIEGDGYFLVKTPDGIRYTRKGSFSKNNKDQLITQEGYPVLGKKGEIKVSGKEFSVDGNGDILIDGAKADSFKIVDFPLPRSLKKESDLLFVPIDPNTKESQPADFKLFQGFLESSNVKVVKEMVYVMETLRMDETYQKVIQSFDAIDTKAANEIGRLG